jgi:transposase
MPIINGFDRHQISFSSLEDSISSDNEVRFIDAFVDKLDLQHLGVQSLTQAEKQKAGRAAFSDALFLKLYLYAYLNGLRSSRRLEREAARNIELQWLLQGLRPNYHSIADFRKINATALKNLFKLFVLFLKDAGLVGGKIMAVDGTKIRGNNSKKNNYNPKKIERHLAYIEEKTQQYLQQLEVADQEENQARLAIDQVQAKLETLKTHKIKYEQIKEQLVQSDEPQVSTTDPDARALLVRGVVVEVGYNVQAAVDAQHSLVIGTHTINRNDKNELYNICKEAKENIEQENIITVLADKGYHTAKELQACQDAGIDTIVARQELVNSNEKGTQPAYMVQHFRYNKEADTYTCPAGQTLHTTGTLHTKKRDRDISYSFKKYRTSACNTCPVKHLCTGRKDGRREIERSEFADAVERNKTNYETNGQLYRKRQEINEHIFGTIKRQWNLYYTNLRGLEKVNGELALIMTVYNMKRTRNILGHEQLMENLKNWTPKYPGGPCFKEKRLCNLRFKPRYFLHQNLAA